MCFDECDECGYVVVSQVMVVVCFFFSSRRRHTRCALVTGVQTCALPIFSLQALPSTSRPAAPRESRKTLRHLWFPPHDAAGGPGRCASCSWNAEIGRASCRERVCQYV